MTPALKQRVVGAIVLVALAVIFVPMLLDGSGRRAGEQVPVEIPEAPSQPDPDITTNPDVSRSEGSPSGAAGVATASASAGGADKSDKGDTSASSKSASQGQDTGQAGSSGATGSGTEGDPGSAARRADGADAERTTEGSAGESGSAWVVQVGSFARQTNAIVLRDRLREDGRNAFIDSGTTQSGQVWRVRVGPVSERGQAEKLKRRLDREHGFDALVMAQSD